MTMMVARVVIEVRQPSVEGVDDRTFRSVVPVARSRQSFECRPHFHQERNLVVEFCDVREREGLHLPAVAPLILPQAQQ